MTILIKLLVLKSKFQTRKNGSTIYRRTNVECIPLAVEHVTSCAIYSVRNYMLNA